MIVLLWFDILLVGYIFGKILGYKSEKELTLGLATIIYSLPSDPTHVIFFGLVCDPNISTESSICVRQTNLSGCSANGQWWAICSEVALGSKWLGTSWRWIGIRIRENSLV